MTKNERHRVYDGLALVLSSLGMAFGLPALVSAHDSVALIAALLLVVGWFANATLYLYRMKG